LVFREADAVLINVSKDMTWTISIFNLWSGIKCTSFLRMSIFLQIITIFFAFISKYIYNSRSCIELYSNLLWWIAKVQLTCVLLVVIISQSNTSKFRILQLHFRFARLSHLCFKFYLGRAILKKCHAFVCIVNELLQFFFLLSILDVSEFFGENFNIFNDN
jgi:hypothetical protein